MNQQLQAMIQHRVAQAMPQPQTVITGGQNDLLPTAFMTQGVARARAVAMIREDGVPKGTGFLIPGGLFVTNHHVLPERPAPGKITLTFGFWLDEQGVVQPGTLCEIDAERFWLTSPLAALDCTVVALGAFRDGGRGDLPLAIPLVAGMAEPGGYLNIIQHPGGRAQQVVLRNNVLLANPKPWLHYASDTEAGSSGAPVFNDRWQLVGVHHGSVPDAEGQRINEGLAASALIAWLSEMLPQLPSPMQPQLQNALRGDLHAQPLVGAPDSYYANRDGYQPAFLGEQTVTLKDIVAPRAAEVAPLLDGRSGSDAILNYEHFSLVMHASRRLAFFTATNIDGARYVAIDRASGQPSLLAEADSWVEESRLDSRYQTGQAFYREFSRWFDRGHLTRRSDPTWGTAEEAMRANRDTFHFTNCSPQHFRFNQSLKYWQGIERYILEFGVLKSKNRITVLTGPVLNGDARPYGEVSVPLLFWKVVLRIGPDGEPQATALIASQAALMDEPRRLLARTPAESAPDVDEFRITVAGLESLTGLDFSAFRHWDSWQPAPVLRADPLPAALILAWEDLL